MRHIIQPPFEGESTFFHAMSIAQLCYANHQWAIFCLHLQWPFHFCVIHHQSSIKILTALQTNTGWWCGNSSPIMMGWTSLFMLEGTHLKYTTDNNPNMRNFSSTFWKVPVQTESLQACFLSELTRLNIYQSTLHWRMPKISNGLTVVQWMTLTEFMF